MTELSYDQHHQALKDAIEEHAGHHHSSRGGVMLGFVVISEWAVEGGESIAIEADSRVSSWRLKGLLHEVLEMESAKTVIGMVTSVFGKNDEDEIEE